LWRPNEIKHISKESHVISTHRLTTAALQDFQHPSYIEILGVPMLQNELKIKEKEINNDKLTVCFSSKVSQSFVLEKYSYANQQEKVFNFIEEIYQKHSI
jgi:hypothetical protein